MEGRGISDLYRNTSEELILRSYMESSNGSPIPTMEMLGFKNLSQNFRADSEELFKSWLTTGETNINSPSIAHRTRSRRISMEISNLSPHQHVGLLQRKISNEVLLPQYNPIPEEISDDLNQHSNRPGVERGLQASDIYLAKAWFHSSQAMTRSRSSELRKRYVALQNSQPPTGPDNLQNAPGNYTNVVKQELTFPNGFSAPPSICEVPKQLGTFISPTNSSSSTLDAAQMADMDKVSSVVSMLKGTLERKKLSNQIEKGAEADSCTRLFPSTEAVIYTCFDQGQGDQLQELVRTYQELSTIEVKENEFVHKVEGSINVEMEGLVSTIKPNQASKNSQEPSQSESSAAAPVVSSGIDVCDGPSNSSQTMSICESSLKRPGNRSSENGSRSKDIRERIIGNLKDDQKRGKRLERYGSVTSAVSGDKEDATKKRRVERSRKMAEAKERNSTPVIPSDIQSVLNRCENLEKEVRSLKLNLSFMNRKDSEQTKQIEELQQQNEELADEKERLLEEIEKLLAENGKI